MVSIGEDALKAVPDSYREAAIAINDAPITAAYPAVAALLEWSGRIGLGRPGAWTRLVMLPRAAHGMTLAHFGMAVLIAGVASAASTDAPAKSEVPIR